MEYESESESKPGSDKVANFSLLFKGNKQAGY